MSAASLPASPDGAGDLAADAVEALASGYLFGELARRVAFRTESQRADARPELYRYLREEIGPTLERLGFTTAIHDNPLTDGPPFLTAERIEDPRLPTVLLYGHGDAVNGDAGTWTGDHEPFVLKDEGERWYGRGSADNKGQHTIGLVALELVLRRNGRFGCNLRYLLEMGEELGSPGLRAFVAEKGALLAADLLIASDGPRWRRDHPTIFLGARGHLQFQLLSDLRTVNLHSGNWGGLAANPGTLVAQAIAALVDARGLPAADPLLPRPMPSAMREHFRRIPSPDAVPGIAVEENWGPEGSHAERVLAAGGIEVLAYAAGDIGAPQSAIPPAASAVLAYNFTVDFDPTDAYRRIQEFLDRRGLGLVKVSPTNIPIMGATRTDPDLPIVAWARDRLAAVTGVAVDLLPNMGGALPNDIFAEDLGLTTIWVPHSYSGSQQHGGDEHVLRSVMEQGLKGMTSLFGDLGSLSDRPGTPPPA